MHQIIEECKYESECRYSVGQALDKPLANSSQPRFSRSF
jgi:hypothetical protein